jgi:hypothetical protein
MTARRNVQEGRLRKYRYDAADTTRNECQKTVLLYEVSRMRRQQSSELVDECHDVIARNKKLREKTKSLLNNSRRVG